MSRRNIILSAIIGVMVLGTVFVLYRGFYAKPAGPASAVPAAGTANLAAEAVPSGIVASPVVGVGGEHVAPVLTLDPNKILPLGTKFDFTLIKKYNVDSRLYNYPEVDPAEVGPDINALIKTKP